MEIGRMTGRQGLDQGRGTIVFIHGAGGSAWSWLGLLSALGRRFNTLALDLPGHGQTPGPAPATIEACAEWLARALEELGRELGFKPDILAGHSMGGAVAQALALAWPGRARGLVLIGTGARLAVNPKLLAGLENDFQKTVGLINEWCFHSGSEALKAESKRLMALSGREVLLADFRACAGFDLVDQVGRIQEPALVITGAEDKMTPPALGRALAEALPAGRLELVPQAGHMVMVEQPRATMDLIAAFTEQVLG